MSSVVSSVVWAVAVVVVWAVAVVVGLPLRVQRSGCRRAGARKVDFLSQNGYGKGLKLFQILGASGRPPGAPTTNSLSSH